MTMATTNTPTPTNLSKFGRLLTIAETAHVIGTSATHVRRLIASGQLPEMRDGRVIRIPASAVDDWIERHIAGTGDAA